MTIDGRWMKGENYYNTNNLLSSRLVTTIDEWSCGYFLMELSDQSRPPHPCSVEWPGATSLEHHMASKV